jgi:hypothetical protein
MTPLLLLTNLNQAFGQISESPDLPLLTAEVIDEGDRGTVGLSLLSPAEEDVWTLI